MRFSIHRLFRFAEAAFKTRPPGQQTGFGSWDDLRQLDTESEADQERAHAWLIDNGGADLYRDLRREVVREGICPLLRQADQCSETKPEYNLAVSIILRAERELTESNVQAPWLKHWAPK